MFEKPEGHYRLRVDDVADTEAGPGMPGLARSTGDQNLADHRSDRSRWHWLLAVPVLVPLLTPLYDRLSPRQLGLPFFYWFQLAFVGLAVLVTTVVYQATKHGRRP